jgi:prepilin-type N-terminal cleavage/methylation domain-containing protein
MKKAFTLIEVIISIFIFSLIMIFLYKSISSLKINNKNLKNTTQKSKNLSKTITLLKSDLTLSKKIDLKLLQKDILSIDTTLNSIHNIAKPKVIWKILKQSKTLVRVEKINGLTFLDDTTLKCKKFKIYYSEKEQKILIYIKTVDNKEIITETIINGKKSKKKLKIK